MLSILDLLDAGTLDLELAAYMMARMSGGASLMVGANPGGAGKTTVMCALLNLLPVDLELVAATARVVRQAAGEEQVGRKCYVCHEIGSGSYFAYLWDEDLRRYCSLLDQGHVLGTNLHADDLGEAHEQVCRDNGVPEGHFHAFDLLVFLRIGGGFGRPRRWIEKVYASEEGEPHRLIYDAGGEGLTALEEPNQQECRRFLEEALPTGARTIEEVRERVVEFYGKVSVNTRPPEAS